MTAVGLVQTWLTFNGPCRDLIKYNGLWPARVGGKPRSNLGDYGSDFLSPKLHRYYNTNYYY